MPWAYTKKDSSRFKELAQFNDKQEQYQRLSAALNDD